jgi:hypothetical protein
MQFCFCLTSDGKDTHAASTLVSALSIRAVHHDATIIVVCDEASGVALTHHRHPLLDAISALLPIRAPQLSPALRNRFVKTRLRQNVRGDFLYLDGDTVVLRPLDAVFQITAPVAAAWNHNSSDVLDPAFTHDLAVLTGHGWSLPQKHYVNGGVLLLRDLPEVHSFAELWHHKWLQTSANGSHFDQPALNSALHDSGIEFQLLPHHFNAQVQVRPRTALGAHIWHIYASEATSPATGLDALVKHVCSNGEISSSQVIKYLRGRDPWQRRTPLDGVVIRRMIQQRDFLPRDCFERDWLSGHYRNALQRLMMAATARMRRKDRGSTQQLSRPSPWSPPEG